MFHVHGLAGRIFSGPIEQMPLQAPVGAVARAARAAAGHAGPEPGEGRTRQALAAHAARAPERRPLDLWG
jgi:hypothetical protein